MIGTRHHKNRDFLLILALATIAHLLLLLVPVVRQQAIEHVPYPAVSLRLVKPPAPPPQSKPPERAGPPRLQAVEPVTLAELPAEPPETAEPQTPAAPRFDAQRVLSDIRERQAQDPLRRIPDSEPRERPDYFVYERPGLEEVLKEPSLQLPFRDRRVYLLDSYDAGFGGNVQRFFDDVTVPFGFTTKNNTRIQCAWVLILAGCSWGHVSLYQGRDRAIKRR